MTTDRKRPSVRCPICKTSNAGAIEYAKPAVLLCDCARCGKYILKKKTFLRLAQEKDFDAYRHRISKRINRHFKKFKRPLQIVSYAEKPLTQDAITIGKLISLCQGDAMREEAVQLNRESRSDFESEKVIYHFSPASA